MPSDIVLKTPTISASLQKLTNDVLYVVQCLGDKVACEKKSIKSKEASETSNFQKTIEKENDTNLEPSEANNVSPGEVSDIESQESVIEMHPSGNDLEEEMNTNNTTSPGEVQTNEKRDSGYEKESKLSKGTSEQENEGNQSAETQEIKPEADFKADSFLPSEETFQSDEHTQKSHDEIRTDGQNSVSTIHSKTLQEGDIKENDSIESKQVSQASRRTHSFVRAILKKEASVEVSKLLIEAHHDDLRQEELLIANMTLKNSLKHITNDIMKVTGYLGTNPIEKTLETLNSQNSVEENSDKSDVSKEEKILKSKVEEDVDRRIETESVKSIDIKQEIKKFTDDILRVTSIMGEMQKQEIIKIEPFEDNVYMKGGIDAMSCTTMEASPTR